MNRIPTGVPGFDMLLGGGIPEKDLVLVSGACGSGKTIFGLQFLFSSDEHGIYVSFEDELEHIRDTATSFGWDADKAEKSRKITFLKYDPYRLEDIFEIIENNIRELNARRVVIDSVSALGIYMKDTAEFRRMVLQINNMLRKNRCTALLISEIVPGKSLSRFGVEEFVCDGVIVLRNFLAEGEYKRGLSIIKMRATGHSRKIHSYEITEKGLVVHPEIIIKPAK